jgi:hypothetical protein
MHRNPSSILSPAPRRLGLLRALAFLWLAGLLWSWGQAQAHTQPVTLPIASDELAHAIAVVEADAMAAAMTPPDVPATCVKPLPSPASGADQVCNEVSDQDALPYQLAWGLPPQVVRQSAVQPAPQQAERQPLLRPPIRLG